MTTDTTDAGDGYDVALEIQDDGSRRLTIAVPPGRVRDARARERDRLSRTLKLKGFRKGKVPAAVVEQRFGEVLDERVRETLIEKAYRAAVAEHGLQPVGPARVDRIQYAPGERLTFEAIVEVMPSVELARTGGFKLRREVEDVKDEEVREILERIRAQHGSWGGVDRKPAEGDQVAVRVAPIDPSEETPTREAKSYRFELGSGQALPDVEKAIATLAPGEEGTFLVEFPGEEGAEAESRRLYVALDEVEERILPEMDDALANEASGGEHETVADLERAIREDLARQHEAEAEGRLRGQLLDALVDANPFTVPRSLVERYLDGMLQAPEDADPEELRKARESVAPQAERRIREELLLDRVIEREELVATPEEIDARVAEMAERRGVSPAQLRGRLDKEGGIERLARNLAVDRAFDYLKSQSSID
jgi:trigger factor